MTMLDTTTDQTDTATADVQNVATASPPPEHTATRPKAKTAYDAVAHIATVTMPGAAPSGYDIGALPETARAALLGRGATHYLTSHPKGPEAAYQALLSGDYAGRKTAAPKPLDPKRQAIANAIAEAQAKQQGIKPLPGKKLDAHSDYRMLLDNASQQVAGWNKDQVKAAHAKADVAAHYARLSAAGGSVLDLLDTAASAG